MPPYVTPASTTLLKTSYQAITSPFDDGNQCCQNTTYKGAQCGSKCPGGPKSPAPPGAVEKQLSQAPNVTFVVEEAPAQDEPSRCPEEILFEQCKELSINREWNAESGEAKNHLAR